MTAPAVAPAGVRPLSSTDQDIARNATCLFAVVAALLLVSGSKLLNDPDSHWHVAVGRFIWEARAVPWTDPFSHTFAGAPWIAKEWLSQLVLFGAHALAGWRGVVILTAATGAASFALLFAWLQQRIRVPTALLMTIVALILSLGGLLARPHVLALPVVILWTASLVTAAERRSAPPWYALLIMVLWVNLHGSFTIGYAIAGLLAAHAVLMAEHDERMRTGVRWALFLAAAVLAGCVSPYGYRAMLVTVTLFGSGESLPFIREWQPLALDLYGSIAIAALALATLALLVRFRENIFLLLVVALFGYMMIQHTRFTTLFGLVAPIVMAGPLVRAFPGLTPFRPATARTPPWWLAGALLVLPLTAALAMTPRPNPLTTPEGALAAARAAGLTGPVYNDYDYGGYLISEGVRTFIDGRTDQLFLGGFITEVNAAARSEGHERFAALLHRYGVTWALVRPESKAIRHLDALPGWQRVYADERGVVYARR